MDPTRQAASSLAKPVILIADDHAIFRAGLRVLLQDEFPDHDVAEAADLDQALDLAGRAARLALIVIDLSMPGMDGPESIAAVADGFPESRIAVVTASESREDVIAALDAGALGYIPKALSAEETRVAVAAVLRGETYVPGRLLRVARPSASVVARPAREAPAGLTPRQREVGQLLARGLSTKEIARAMALGEGTVKVHLAGLYRALGARNRQDAVLKAAQLIGR